MADVGFLSDIKEIIAGTQSPLQISAEAARKLQASSLPEKIRIIRKSTFCDDLTSHNSEDVLTGAADFLESVTKGKVSWPSLSALVFWATTKFGVNLESAEAKIALTSATLGEIPNNLPFHNNARYRKVLMSTIRQISIHNDLYRDTEWERGSREISLMMTAANIQDFMYNRDEDGEHSLELKKKSFELAKPFLIEAGADEEFLEDLQTIVLSSCVKSFDQSEISHLQVKEAYRYYFDGQGAKPELSDDMRRLHDNPKLCLMAALFHEADLMPSLVFGHWQAKSELVALAKEMGFMPSPEAQINFMNGISDSFLTKAGKINRDNFNSTLQAFKQDRVAGIINYDEDSAVTVPLPDSTHAVERRIDPN